MLSFITRITILTFQELHLIAPLLDALKQEGYTQPTPIQQQAIPHILKGRDLLGCAQTGTGKTAAFALPILQNLQALKMQEPHERSIKTLVLTPTRELAIQIEESFRAYGRHTRQRMAVIFGGVNQFSQVQTLQRGVDILIATPGRLLDLMQQGFISLANLKIFVLDEADRMLDMGFVHDVKKIITKLPAKRQTLFFSATMPPEIQKLADTILTNPAKVAVTPVSSTVEVIQQKVYQVSKQDKRHLLQHLLANEINNQVLVFSRTKHGADKIVKDLQHKNIEAAAIHGNKSQNARQKALNDFKSGRIQVLVATDIAARGIDIDELSFVINYDLPEVPETYVHRIGRTGRAGASGASHSFCDWEERDNLKDIQKLIGKNIPVAEHPFVQTAPPVPRHPEEVMTPGMARTQQRGGNRRQGTSGRARQGQRRG